MNSLNHLIYNFISAMKHCMMEGISYEPIYYAFLASFFDYNVWATFSYYAKPDILERMKRDAYPSDTFLNMMKEYKEKNEEYLLSIIHDMKEIEIEGVKYREFTSGSGAIVYVRREI